MPALSVIDNTPRDCPTPFCGAEADTSILVPGEAATMPLGRNSKGAVVAATMMKSYMSGASKHNIFKPASMPHTLVSFEQSGPKMRLSCCPRNMSSF